MKTTNNEDNSKWPMRMIFASGASAFIGLVCPPFGMLIFWFAGALGLLWFTYRIKNDVLRFCLTALVQLAFLFWTFQFSYWLHYQVNPWELMHPPASGLGQG